MRYPAPNLSPSQPCVFRLSALAALDHADVAAVEAAARGAHTIRARREIPREHSPATGARLLISGWAARIRWYPDGRGQVLHLLVPGDLVQDEDADDSFTNLFALTQLTLAVAPSAEKSTGLAAAYQRSASLAQQSLLRQIARLGRLDAYERMADLLLELSERLELAGLRQGNQFPLPLTQEVLADCLGLTSVHVNRTLQVMRRNGVLEMRGSMARLLDANALRSLVDYRPLQRPR
jgi:CRP-like cAMP-binding protein